MKKIVLIIALIATSATTAQLKIGVNAGIPVGDDLYSFAFGTDLMYMSNSEKATAFGFATGFIHYIGQDFGLIEIEDASFLPLACLIRHNISDKFTLGGDMGYAIGLSSKGRGSEGGFYYKPSIGYSIGTNSKLNLYYLNITKNLWGVSNLGLGISFGL